jgi:hypothetical protein
MNLLLLFWFVDRSTCIHPREKKNEGELNHCAMLLSCFSGEYAINKQNKLHFPLI